MYLYGLMNDNKIIIIQRKYLNTVKQLVTTWNKCRQQKRQKRNGKILRILYLMQQMITLDMRKGNHVMTDGRESVN
jgi:hypothetical protein